jgi:hypothetical protein
MSITYDCPNLQYIRSSQFEEMMGHWTFKRRASQTRHPYSNIPGGGELVILQENLHIAYIP